VTVYNVRVSVLDLFPADSAEAATDHLAEHVTHALRFYRDHHAVDIDPLVFRHDEDAFASEDQ